MKLRIAILGTRGIPNYYGGYEQAVSFIGPGLAKKGHDVTVYNSQQHPYKDKQWNGVGIIHQKDPENSMGTVGQFIYDLNCIRHAARCRYDVWLMMGYTSSSVWGRIYPKQPAIISHMDGLEWKRSKYAKPVRKFLQWAEKLAICHSDFFIADSIAIQQHLEEKYQVQAKYIPYGAIIYENEREDMVRESGLSPYSYYLMVARLEPENNIETILDGFCQTNSSEKFVVTGNTQTPFGKRMLRKFHAQKNIIFTGSIFDQEKLHNLKRYCRLYFHGHSVGGTNPSLLEAMASRACIAAHDNPFNRAVTGNNAYYFKGAGDVAAIISTALRKEEMISNNLNKINECYNWDKIIDQYESMVTESYHQKRK